MAIDVYSVKSNASSDGKYQPTKESTGNGGVDFADLMRSSSARVGSGLAASVDKGISTVTEKSDTALAYNDRPQDYGDDYAESYDTSDTGANHAPRHDDDRPQASHRDDQTRDQVATAGSDHSDPAGETSTQASTAGNDDDTSGKPNEASSENDAADQESSSDDGAAADNDNGKTSGQSANTDGETTEQAAKASDGATATPNKGTTSNAEQILSSLLATAQTNAPSGKTSDQASDSAKKGGPGENAVNGLTNALANATKNNDATGTAGAQTAANANTKTTPNDGANTHANQTAKAGANPQSANAAAAQAPATAAETAAKETAAQQSAQMSKMVGNGPKVSVSVETKTESSAVVSKPSTSLTSNAALIGENSRGHQSQNATGQNQANPTQNQANAGQAQAATTQAAVQAQANTPASNEAKGPAQTAQHVGATNPVAAGSGEGAVATGTVNAAHQAQHSAPAQAASATRLATPGQAVTDQVTVQITKAINAGADKISIQLKPADLGRIDVKMEVSHDGRVSAVVTADNKNTLDLLQRDSKELQQALQNAGMQMDNDSLSFNLRGQNEQGQDSQTAGSGPVDNSGEGSDTDSGDQLATQARDIISDTRVDIRA